MAHLDTYSSKESNTKPEEGLIVGLNPFFSRESTAPDNRAVPVIPDNRSIEKAIEEYMKLQNEDTFPDPYIIESAVKGLILSPLEIKILYDSLMQIEHKYLVPGDFVTAIIQNSVCWKYPKFSLTTTGDLDYNIGSNLKGKWYRPINLDIHGPVGSRLGCSTELCYITAHSDVGEDCGSHSLQSTFILEGKVAHRLGQYSKNCGYKVKGEIGDGAGLRAQYCTFTFESDMRSKNAHFLSPLLYSENSVMRTHDESVFNGMCDYADSYEFRVTNLTIQLLDEKDKTMKEQKVNWD